VCQRDLVSALSRQTVTFRCTMSMSLPFERSRTYSLTSTNEMSEMETGHSVDVVSEMVQEVIKVAQKFGNAVQLVIWLRFHSSATEDVDHNAFMTRTLGRSLRRMVILSSSTTNILALL